MHQSTYFGAEAALISPRLSRILKLSREVASCYWSLLARRSYTINDYIINSSLIRLSWFRSEHDPNFFSIRIVWYSSGFSMRDRLIISLGVANFCRSRISICLTISCPVVNLRITSYLREKPVILFPDGREGRSVNFYRYVETVRASVSSKSELHRGPGFA